MTDLPPLGEGETPEEKERLAAVREQLSAAGLPTDGVGFLSLDAEVDAIAAAEAAVFIPAKAFTFRRLGTNPLLPTIELVAVPWLSDAITKQTLTCELYGVGHEIDGVEVPLFAHLRFRVRGNLTPVYIEIAGATEDWIRWAMRRFAILLPDERWLATGNLNELETPLRVPGKIGRNDPCPCGSGRKVKRCCGV